MKKLSLLFGLAIVLFAGCKKENPTASTVKRVSIPEVVSFMDDQYLGAVGGVFDAAIERVDGIVGYAVDTVYGFDVNGETVDTLFFTDPAYGGDTLVPGVVSLNLVATNKGGYTGTAVSTFLVLDPPSDPYPDDISGNYIRNGVAVAVVEKVVDGVYLMYGPIFSTNLAWLDTYCIVYHSVSTGLDMVDQDPPGFPGFGTFTFTNESFDPVDYTICADMNRIEDGLALSRCVTRE